MRKLIIFAVGLGLLWVQDRPADACGVKLTVKTPHIKKVAAREPTASSTNPTPTRAAHARQPIARGPVETRTPTRAREETTPTHEATPQPADTTASNDATATPASDTDSGDNSADLGRQNDSGSSDSGSSDSGDDSGTHEVTHRHEHHASAGGFATHIFFSNGSADLSDRFRGKLTQDAKWLAAHPDKSITIQGHANTTGSPEANQEISQQRADAVKAFLVDQGVDASRIQTEAFGMDKPEYQPGTSGKNRRVVIVVNQ